MNKDLEKFLQEAQKHFIITKEQTLFGLGGRGYFENPASDLLAFFLKPDAEHGLGDLFLKTYFECMEQSNLYSTRGVKIKREGRTAKGNKVDLQIVGLDWCLIIENKIRHWDANDFSDYESHAQSLVDAKHSKLFSILSPDGHSHNTTWIGVSYQKYCQALRQRIATAFFEKPLTKWLVFAREFIFHMENELYNPPTPMSKDSINFVENNASQIAEVKKLDEKYREFIRQEIKRRLESTDEGIPGNAFDTWEGVWPGNLLVIYCSCPKWQKSAHGKENDIVLFRGEDTDKKFYIRVYLDGMSASTGRCSNATDLLVDMKSPVRGRTCYWDSKVGFDSSEEAITHLCKLAKIVDEFLKK